MPKGTVTCAGATSKRARNRRGQGQRLHGEIVDAAVRLVDETGGTDAVTLRGVAREVGITPMPIYTHFPDRDAILAEVLKQSLRELLEAMTALDDLLTDPVERLFARCAAYVAFARHRPQRFALFEAVSHSELALEEAQAAFGVFVSGIEDCVAARRARSADPFADATAVWVAVHGLASLRIHHPDFPWQEDERTWIKDTVCRLARISSKEIVDG